MTCGTIVCALACLGADAPRFDGLALPEPPAQHEAWTSSATSIPKFLVSATAALFEQGMADPRGCDYRSIELGVGKAGGSNGQVVTTHGWVLPAVEGQSRRFAVAWNGLVYPLVSVGEAADIAADAKGLAEFASNGFDDFDDRHSTTRGIAPRSFDGFASFGVEDEATAVDFSKVAPIKVVILLRLGRVDLAESVWTAGLGHKAKEVAEAKVRGGVASINYGVSYLTLASNLAWNRFHRAVGAHARRNDALALIDARTLVPLQVAIESKAQSMGFPRPAGGIKGPGPTSYLGFLAQLPALVADQERRAVEPKQGPVPARGVGEKAARIAALIRHLDEVTLDRTVNTFDQFVETHDPALIALVDEGEDAVAPLIEALDHDTRLTRSLEQGMEGVRPGHSTSDTHLPIVPTRRLIYIALTRILKTNVFRLDDRPVTRKPTQEVEVEQIRAYWERYKGVSLAERWYKALANDTAGTGAWLDAARSIVGDTYPPPDPKTPAIGQSLRQGHDPSVSALMARRVSKQLAASTFSSFGLDDAEGLALLLAKWDGPAAVAPLRDVFQLAREWYAMPGGDGRGMAPKLARLTIERARVGDPEAFRDFADWARKSKPESVRSGDELLTMFEPFWRNPADPSISAASDWVFNDPKSAWVPFIHPKAANSWYDLANLIPSPMAGVPDFRKMLLAALLDPSPFGSAELDAEGNLTYEMDSGGAGGTSQGRGDPMAPKPGVKVRFRRSDLFAWKLSEVRGTPLFELYWPEARRDQGLAEMTAFLTRYGDHLGPSQRSGRNSHIDSAFPYPKAHLNFPLLDHPASPREVEAGQAIFTRDGDRYRHLVKLPERPIRARWVTLKEFPSIRKPVDPKVGPVTVYEQSGWVWQAEGAWSNGKIRNFYGFVGPHGVAVLPEDEIEFSDWPFGGEDRLTNGLDASWLGPFPPDQTKPIAPVVMKLRLKNRSGRFMQVPTEYFRLDAGKVVALRGGVTLTVDRAPADPSFHPFTRPFQSEPKWEPVKSNAQAPFVPKTPPELKGFHPDDQSIHDLNPSESFDAFTIDLNDLFDLRTPGLYRVTLSFSTDSLITERTLAPRIFNLPLKPDDGPR